MSISQRANFEHDRTRPRRTSLHARNVEHSRSAASGRRPAGASCLETPLDAWVFGRDYAGRQILENFKLLSLDGCGLADKPLATAAAGAVLHYLRDTQTIRARSSKPARRYYRAARSHDRSMRATIRNLELLEPLFAGESRECDVDPRAGQNCDWNGRPSVAPAIAESVLPTGGNRSAARCRRRNSRQRPLCAPICARRLSRIQDLERLLAKMTLGTGRPRELLASGRSLGTTSGDRKTDGAVETPHCVTKSTWSKMCATRILSAIADEPPVNLADGGAIRDGFHAALDELRDISRNSRQYIAAIETRERAATGIQSLKIRFNNVFGYYIEISKTNLPLVPAAYERKQTLANAERFTTPELKELEAKVLSRRREDPRRSSVRSSRAFDLPPPATPAASNPRPPRSRNWM